MYYLLKYTDNTTIVSNCSLLHHKMVVLSNYCQNNNIKLVNTRQEINDKNRTDHQIFCYPVDNNKWLLIDATFHEETLFFSSYSEKYPIGYLAFQYYVKAELPIPVLKKETIEDKKKHIEMYGN